MTQGRFSRFFPATRDWPPERWKTARMGWATMLLIRNRENAYDGSQFNGIIISVMTYRSFP